MDVERYSEFLTYLMYMFAKVDRSSEVMLIFSLKDSTKHLFHVPQRTLALLCTFQFSLWQF